MQEAQTEIWPQFSAYLTLFRQLLLSTCLLENIIAATFQPFSPYFVGNGGMVNLDSHFLYYLVAFLERETLSLNIPFENAQADILSHV